MYIYIYMYICICIYIYIYYICKDKLAKLRPWGAILSGPGCARAPGARDRVGPDSKIQICARAQI